MARAAAGQQPQLRSVGEEADRLADKVKGFMTNIDDVTSVLKEAAGVMYTLGGSGEQVEAFRERLLTLKRLHHDARAHRETLGDIRSNYTQQGQVPTDFAARLRDGCQSRLDSSPFDPRTDSDVQEFDSVTERPADPAGGADDDDDDLVVVGANEVNRNCPLTMKDVYNLDHPVRDQLGYIYERSAIIALIGRATQVPCPVLGTRHMVSVDSLKDATEIRLKKRLRRLRGNTQAQGTQAEVIDDEDDIVDV